MRPSERRIAIATEGDRGIENRSDQTRRLAMLVKDVMSTRVETIAPTSNVRDCARKMDQVGVGLLPVADKGKLVGVVTDRDICCSVVARDRDPETVTVREIMTTDVASCLEEQDCTEAARLMEDKRVRRLPVVNRQQAMTGLISIDDLARCSHDLAGQVLEAAAPWPH
jgi:CBS domain-containing protein